MIRRTSRTSHLFINAHPSKNEWPIYIYIYTYIYKHIHIHTNTHMDIYIYIYTCVCYSCIYRYVTQINDVSISCGLQEPHHFSHFEPRGTPDWSMGGISQQLQSLLPMAGLLTGTDGGTQHHGIPRRFTKPWHAAGIGGTKPENESKWIKMTAPPKNVWRKATRPSNNRGELFYIFFRGVHINIASVSHSKRGFVLLVSRLARHLPSSSQEATKETPTRSPVGQWSHSFFETSFPILLASHPFYCSTCQIHHVHHHRGSRDD